MQMENTLNIFYLSSAGEALQLEEGGTR